MGWLGDLAPVIGAGIGTIIAPGAGTAIGGALGGAVGGAINGGTPTADGGTQTSEYGWISPALTTALQYGLSYLSESERSEAIEEANTKNIDLAEESNELEREKWELQKQLLEGQMQGTTTPDGRTYFDDQRGWVTDLNPDAQATYDAQGNVLRRMLTSGDQRNASIEGDNYARSLEAGGEADNLLREFQGIQKREAGPLADQIVAAGQRGYNQTMDDNEDMITRAMIRQGATPESMATTVSNRARGDADAAASMESKALLDAMSFADSEYAGERSNTADLYTTFANRAGAGASPSAASSVRGPSTGANAPPSINANLSSPQFSATGDAYSADAELYGGLSTLLGNEQSSARDDARWDALVGMLSTSGKGSATTGAGNFGSTQPTGTGNSSDNAGWLWDV